MFNLKPQPVPEDESDKIMHQFFEWEKNYETMRQDLTKAQEIWQWEKHFLREA